jgi:DNA helicase II / ATP-dependent DNA helicase PcrA
VLGEYHRRFKYILVDEYQDTNTSQYMWLRLLAQRPGTSGGDVPARDAQGRASDTIAPTGDQHLLRRR